MRLVAPDCKSGSHRDAVGSNPTTSTDADVAQLVEFLLCNEKVGGSSPLISLDEYTSSKKTPCLVKGMVVKAEQSNLAKAE